MQEPLADLAEAISHLVEVIIVEVPVPVPRHGGRGMAIIEWTALMLAPAWIALQAQGSDIRPAARWVRRLVAIGPGLGWQGSDERPPRERGAQRVSHGADESVGTWGERRAWALTGERVSYTLAVLGYIAIVLGTKQFSSFTWGVLYFVIVLEVLPRVFRRIRGLVSQRSGAAMSEMTGS